MIIRQDIATWFTRAFFVIFFLFMMNRLFFFSTGFIEQATSCIVYPFVKVYTWIKRPFVAVSDHVQQVSALRNQIEQLQHERDRLQARVVEHEATQEFAQQTQEIRKFAQRYQQDKYVLAQVLLRTASSEEDTLIIDAGSRDGVVQQAVVLVNNCLVGKVIEVYPWYSKVALITDKRCNVAAHCVHSQVTGICCGQNNGKIQLQFVPHYDQVIFGDELYSTGEGLIFPKGFLLGVIDVVQSDSLEHVITLKPAVDFKQLSYCYVWLG